jgi:predicted nuclease of predicted toxin-antitoxin system
MKPLELPLLTDENIHPDVVAGLRSQGKDVRTVQDEQLRGSDDVTILRRAHATGRVVVTHDSDFGRLAVQAGEQYTGILLLRPGHISPSFVLGILTALEASSITVTPPFIAVVERKADEARVRVRSGE